MKRFAALIALAALPAMAQDNVLTSPIDGSVTVLPDVQEADVRALAGGGVALKGLDRLSGAVEDLQLANGETAEFGRIAITLSECRYPEDNPTGEAYAWLTIRDTRADTLLFDGWMIASSPALNALDHARYDVWVMRCTAT